MVKGISGRRQGVESYSRFFPARNRIGWRLYRV